MGGINYDSRTKKGPFSAGASFEVGGSDARNYVHIGIQIPKSQPIDYIPTTTRGDVRVETLYTKQDYKINKCGILEFDAAVGNSVKVTFLRDLPSETIIDLVYYPEEM